MTGDGSGTRHCKDVAGRGKHDTAIVGGSDCDRVATYIIVGGSDCDREVATYIVKLDGRPNAIFLCGATTNHSAKAPSMSSSSLR